MTGSKLRRALADAGSLFALPILAALLPWRLGFGLLKWWSRRDWLWAAELEAAFLGASQAIPALDRAAFCRELRLILLVDRCDSYLAWLRGAQWWQRHVDVHGDWPATGGGQMLLTFHWGAGHWVYRLLAARGIDAHFIARRADVGDVGRGALARLYLGWRKWSLPRIGGLGVIVTGGSRARIAEALGVGDSVIGMLDLPVEAGQNAVQVSLLGRQALLRSGLAQLAGELAVPVTLFACGLDPQTGRRRLHLESLPLGLPTEAVVTAYATMLGRRIGAQPAAWHGWPHAAQLWRDAG